MHRSSHTLCILKEKNDKLLQVVFSKKKKIMKNHEKLACTCICDVIFLYEDDLCGFFFVNIQVISEISISSNLQ